MQRWIITLALAFAMAGYAQISDTTPPAVASLSISPTSIDVTVAAQRVTVTMRITDNLSGVMTGGAFFSSPSRRQWRSLGLSRISGTPLDGVWQGSVDIPPYSESGVWSLEDVWVYDMVGNSLSLSATVLRALGFPTNLTVVSIPDLTPPVLTGITMSPGAINVSAGPQTITIRLNITDDVSGANLGDTWNWVLSFRSPSGKQESFLLERDFTLISGTGLIGTWQATARFPQFSEPGTWVISWIGLMDKAGNRRSYDTSTLRAMGLTTDLSVTSSPADTTPPVVTGVSFNPSVIDTSAGPQNVTVSLKITDDLSGADFGPDHPSGWVYLHGVLFRSPSGVQSRSTWCPGPGECLIAGTRTNGLWQLTTYFPQYSETGTWRASLERIKDTAGNWVSLTTADLVLKGFSSQLVVYKPSLTPDGSAGPAGGTVSDDAFGSRASITFPSGLLSTSTSVAIDVLSETGLAPTPAGFTAGTPFVNINLDPKPPMPFPAPGISLVLPLASFTTPGAAMNLYRLDPVAGMVPAPSVSGGFVIGAVGPDGLTASFAGIARLSTVVAFRPIAVVGDVNGDGVVNCADLAIVKAAFGKRPGQAGWDARADLNRNNVVDAVDLALVARQIAAGMVCSTTTP